MEDKLHSLIIKTALDHLNQTVSEEVRPFSHKLIAICGCPNYYRVSGKVFLSESGLVLSVLSIVHIYQDLPSYVDCLLYLANNKFVCYASAHFLRGEKKSFGGNNFWVAIKEITGSGKEERNYFNSRPTLSDDPTYWEKCMWCSQGVKKFVGYRDCSECEYLCKKTLSKVLDSFKPKVEESEYEIKGKSSYCE